MEKTIKKSSTTLVQPPAQAKVWNIRQYKVGQQLNFWGSHNPWYNRVQAEVWNCRIFKACAKACASQPRVQPHGFWITSPDHNWKKSWFVKLLSCLLRLLAVFILFLGRSFSYFCLCGLKAGRSSQKWSRSSVQPSVQARYNPKHNSPPKWNGID